MSHIIKTNKDIKKISEQLENLRKKGYTQKTLEEILNTIIPKNESYQVKGIIGDFKKTASLVIEDKIIQISQKKLESCILKLINDALKKFPNLEREELFRNFVIMVLSHEVEHVYQILIGEEYIDFPYQFVVDSYKNVLSLEISKNTNPIWATIITHHFLKTGNKSSFLLERNANIETYDLLQKVAIYENNQMIQNFFEIQKAYQLTLGYKGIYNGSVEQAYNELWLNSLYKSFKTDENIPIKDRVRYGLPIDKETRKKVLKNEFKI